MKPNLKEFCCKFGLEDKSLILDRFYDILESEQLDIVEKNGWAIQYIENPSEEVKLAAVKENGCAIKYIKNPSEAVKLAAINKH